MRHLVLLLGLASVLQLAVGEYVWVNSEWVWKEDAKETPSAGVDSVAEGSGNYDDSYDEGENEKDYEDDDYGEYGSGIKANNKDWTEKPVAPSNKKKNQKGGGGKGAATEPNYNNMNQNVFNSNNNNKKNDDIGFHDESGLPAVTTATTPRAMLTEPPPAAEPAATTTVSPSVERNPNSHSTSFFAQPGILAAVIGGAVVGLLCAILLVMFIVYRMRKKDEGSYALDEPRRSPNVHLYSKAPTREFFA